MGELLVGLPDVNIEGVGDWAANWDHHVR